MKNQIKATLLYVKQLNPTIMKKNIGSKDKFIRLVGAIFILILFYMDILPDIFALIGLIIAFILALSSLMSYSFLYQVLKINTYLRENSEE